MARARKDRHWVSLTAMSEEEKQRTWSRIKAERPGLAALLHDIGKDPVAQQLQQEFDAELMIEAFN